jgi:sugar lactone lactonase YvrE
MPFEDIRVAYDHPMAVGECPLWHHGEKSLYWVDIDGFAVHRLDPASGAHTEWKMDSEPSAIAIHASGGLVVAQRTGLVHLDTRDGTVTSLAAAPYDTSTIRFNDGRVDPAGRFWIGGRDELGDRHAAGMYVLERGQLRTHWPERMKNSNGLAFSPDGRAMYHTDTGTHRIDRYDFDPATGLASNPQPFHQFAAKKGTPGYGGRPDGAAVDSAGNYWCAMFEGGRLLCFAPDGRQLHEVTLPVRCPTMIAFGDDDLRTLYMTTAGLKRPAEERAQYPLSGCVLSVRVDIPGRTEPAYLP